MRRIGPYVVLGQIAAGSTADVFVGRADDGTRVALKQMHHTRMSDEVLLRHFLDEGRLLRCIDSAHVPQALDLLEDGGAPVLVLALVDGPNLQALERLARKASAPLSVDAVVEIGRQTALALDAIHAARAADGTPLCIVHRDVAPANILVGRDGVVKLTDLGVAYSRAARDARMLATEDTQAGVHKGTAAYRAPELVRGGAFDGRADLYALGNVLVEALLGAPLSAADTGVRCARDAEGALAKLRDAQGGAALHQVLGALAQPEPTARPPSARAVAALLADVLAARGADGRAAVAEAVAGVGVPSIGAAV